MREQTGQPYSKSLKITNQPEFHQLAPLEPRFSPSPLSPFTPLLNQEIPAEIELDSEQARENYFLSLSLFLAVTKRKNQIRLGKERKEKGKGGIFYARGPCQQHVLGLILFLSCIFLEK